MNSPGTNFVKRYEPGKRALVQLVNGRILDVINGCYFEPGTSVFLQGGTIQSIPELAGETAGAAPDFSIDLGGRTVLPSLFNTHMHLATSGPTMLASLRERKLIKDYARQQGDKQMADCLAHGITHIRDAWRPYLGENRTLKERITKGEIPGPRIIQAVAVGLPGSYLQEKLSLPMKVLGMEQMDTQKLDCGSVSFPLDADEGQVRDAVDIAIDERGADVIKIGDESESLISGKHIPLMTLKQLTTVADQARCRGVQSMMHHMSLESFRRGVKAGVSSLEHEPFDALLTQADIDSFKAAGCINDPTVSALYSILSWKMPGARSNGHPDLDRLTTFRDQTYTFAEVAEEYFIPELKTSVLNFYKKLANGKSKMLGIIDMAALFAWEQKTALAFENFRLLYENGVLMTTGNDTMPPCTAAMMDLELAMFDHVLSGVPDGKQLGGAEAVRIATINSARSLGVAQQFGSVETGKTADLVVLDGDPLEDFRLIGSRVDALFMDGELVINNCGLQVEPYGSEN